MRNIWLCFLYGISLFYKTVGVAREAKNEDGVYQIFEEFPKEILCDNHLRCFKKPFNSHCDNEKEFCDEMQGSGKSRDHIPNWDRTPVMGWVEESAEEKRAPQKILPEQETAPQPQPEAKPDLKPQPILLSTIPTPLQSPQTDSIPVLNLDSSQPPVPKPHKPVLIHTPSLSTARKSVSSEDSTDSKTHGSPHLQSTKIFREDILLATTGLISQEESKQKKEKIDLLKSQIASLKESLQFGLKPEIESLEKKKARILQKTEQANSLKARLEVFESQDPARKNKEEIESMLSELDQLNNIPKTGQRGAFLSEIQTGIPLRQVIQSDNQKAAPMDLIDPRMSFLKDLQNSTKARAAGGTFGKGTLKKNGLKKTEGVPKIKAFLSPKPKTEEEGLGEEIKKLKDLAVDPTHQQKILQNEEDKRRLQSQVHILETTLDALNPSQDLNRARCLVEKLKSALKEKSVTASFLNKSSPPPDMPPPPPPPPPPALQQNMTAKQTENARENTEEAQNSAPQFQMTPDILQSALRKMKGSNASELSNPNQLDFAEQIAKRFVENLSSQGIVLTAFLKESLDQRTDRLNIFLQQQKEALKTLGLLPDFIETQDQNETLEPLGEEENSPQQNNTLTTAEEQLQKVQEQLQKTSNEKRRRTLVAEAKNLKEKTEFYRKVEERKTRSPELIKEMEVIDEQRDKALQEILTTPEDGPIFDFPDGTSSNEDIELSCSSTQDTDSLSSPISQNSEAPLTDESMGGGLTNDMEDYTESFESLFQEAPSQASDTPSTTTPEVSSVESTAAAEPVSPNTPSEAASLEPQP